MDVLTAARVYLGSINLCLDLSSISLLALALFRFSLLLDLLGRSRSSIVINCIGLLLSLTGGGGSSTIGFVCLCSLLRSRSLSWSANAIATEKLLGFLLQLVELLTIR